jgi:poly-gamma-glutamate synthesis protein (capsule biosynthesis protein)
MAELLRAANVGFGSLANNHIADYGPRGFEDTRLALEAAGIRWAGAGSDAGSASLPATVQVDGLSVGILCLAQPEISAARPGKWGAAVLDERQAISAIAELCRRVDIAVAFLHFGVEFFKYPTPSQVRLARALVDAGARLVIGHHPHLAQGWEWHNGGFIAYSLGNFVFDMRPHAGTEARIGLMVHACVEGQDVKEVSVIPVETAGGTTRFLTVEEKKSVHEEFESLCSVLADKEKLEENYYLTCRGNLEIHLNAFISYAVRIRQLRRVADLFPMQLWPQIRELRVDLIRFLFSGKAFRFEKRRKQGASTVTGRLWLAICYLAGLFGEFLSLA